MSSIKPSLFVFASLALSLAACAPETGPEDVDGVEVGIDAPADVDLEQRFGDDAIELSDEVLAGARLQLSAEEEPMILRDAPEADVVEVLPRPRVCPMNLELVCGVDDRTYANPCVADRNDVDIAHYGMCNSDLIFLHAIEVPAKTDTESHEPIRMPSPSAGEILRDGFNELNDPV